RTSFRILEAPAKQNTIRHTWGRRGEFKASIK
ncbi:uncharacterized protein METZ01_LOCUS316031, partial [marine metagenome]